MSLSIVSRLSLLKARASGTAHRRRPTSHAGRMRGAAKRLALANTFRAAAAGPAAAAAAPASARQAAAFSHPGGGGGDEAFSEEALAKFRRFKHNKEERASRSGAATSSRGSVFVSGELAREAAAFRALALREGEERGRQQLKLRSRLRSRHHRPAAGGGGLGSIGEEAGDATTIPSPFVAAASMSHRGRGRARQHGQPPRQHGRASVMLRTMARQEQAAFTELRAHEAEAQQEQRQSLRARHEKQKRKRERARRARKRKKQEHKAALSKLKDVNRTSIHRRRKRRGVKVKGRRQKGKTKTGRLVKAKKKKDADRPPTFSGFLLAGDIASSIIIHKSKARHSRPTYTTGNMPGDLTYDDRYNKKLKLDPAQNVDRPKWNVH